jgi:hypothetical protein
MRVGLMADVHGNADALRFVLARWADPTDEILLAGHALKASASRTRWSTWSASGSCIMNGSCRFLAPRTME